MNRSPEDALSELAGKRIAVVCVGNALRGDDGFGPAVAARLTGDAVFDAGSVPENVLPAVSAMRPEVVLFVDAAEFGEPPGTLRLLAPDELVSGGVSTHTGSLLTLAEFLHIACGARSMLLAAQAKQTAFGSVMSVEVVKAVESAAASLRKFLRG